MFAFEAKIKDLIEGETSNEEADLQLFSRDASIFEVKPGLIVRPKNTEDIKRIVSLVSENKSEQSGLSVTARAGGSDMTGGPLSDSIVFAFPSHFHHIQE